MRAIWKFPLQITDEQYLTMPQYSQILSVGEQNGKLTLWAMAYVDQPNMKRAVRIYGTGNPIDSEDPMGTFIGTVLMSNGLVWHVYDGGETDGRQ